jgi:hypothetical protein
MGVPMPGRNAEDAAPADFLIFSQPSMLVVQ